jgi:hypothetical protein
MSALSVEHEPRNGNGWDEFVRFWEEMDWPEGCKEIHLPEPFALTIDTGIFPGS